MRLLLSLILALAWCDAGAAIIDVTASGPVSTWADAYSAADASTTIRLGITVTGPVTISDKPQRITYLTSPLTSGFTTSDTNSNTGSLHVASASGVTIEIDGLNLESTGTGGRSFICTATGGNLKFHNNFVKTTTSSNATCYIASPLNYIDFYKNVVLNSRASSTPTALLWSGSVTNGGIYNNTLYSLLGPSFSLSSSVTIKNNNFYGGLPVTLTSAAASLSTFSYCAGNQDITGWTNSVSLTASPFIQTPVFASDFRLNSYGVTACMGATIVGVTDQPDILGRNYSASPNMGAFGDSSAITFTTCSSGCSMSPFAPTQLTSIDTANFLNGYTLAGPVTVTAGTLNNMAVTSSTIDTSTGSINISNSVTLNNALIVNTGTGTSRALYISGGTNVVNNASVSSGGANTSSVASLGGANTFYRTRFISPNLSANTLACVNQISATPATFIGCVFAPGSSGAGIIGISGKVVYNCDFPSGNIGVSITTGVYSNNIFFGPSTPVTGASATFMTNSASQTITGWGSGCTQIPLGVSPWRFPNPVNPWDFRLNWGAWANGGVSIAGVTDGLDLLGLSYRNEAPSMGAVQYWGQGSDEDLTIP